MSTGKLSESYDNDLNKEVNKGEYFGLTSFLFGTPTESSVTVVEESCIFSLSTKSLETTFGQYFRAHLLYSFFRHAIQINPFFSALISEKRLKEVFYLFDLKLFNKSELVCKNQQTDCKVIVVIQGEIVDKSKKSVTKSGDFFGEHYILTKNTDRSFFAYPDLIAMTTNWETLLKTLKLPYSPLQFAEEFRWLSKTPLFAKLNRTKLLFVLTNSKKRTFPDQSTILEQDTIGTFFYILLEGSAMVKNKEQPLRIIQPGGYFGELSLLSNENTTASVISTSDVVVLEMPKAAFESMLDRNLKVFFKKRESLLNDKVELKQLFHLQFLDAGKFGKVNAVHDGKNVYAIKQIPLKTISKNSKLKSLLMNERDVLKSIDCQFCMRMVKTLKDERNIYFLLELVDGLAFDELAGKINSKNVDVVMFYMANMTLAVEYLNEHKIAHRDIKPRNVLVDGNVLF